MTELASLSCPTCGAPLSAGEDQRPLVCDYCKASIVPASAASGVGANAVTNLLCPRCGAGMFVGQAGTFRLLGCGRCGGVWLRPDTERAVLSAVVKAALYLADRADECAAVEVETSQAATCPLCRLPLVRSHHDPSGVDLDRCEEHGTWFDRGELQKVSKGAQALREGWKATLREEEMRRLDEAAAQQAALAEEGPARRLFRALGALLTPADHGGFEDIQDR